MPFVHNLPPTNKVIDTLFREDTADAYSSLHLTSDEIGRVAIGVEIGKVTLSQLSTRLQCGIIAVAYVPNDPERLTVVRRKVDQHGEPIRQFGPAERVGRATLLPQLGEWQVAYDEDTTQVSSPLSIVDMHDALTSLVDSVTYDPARSEAAREILEGNLRREGQTNVPLIDQAISDLTDVSLRPAM